MTLPRITIVTPSFNQGPYLEAAMRSVLDQGYPDLEYIVMDGGSEDGSVDIIRRYADRLTHWESGPDGGQAAAIARGFERSTGEILAWLNSDDLLLPGSLGFVGRTFAENRDVDLIYGARHKIDEAGNVVGVYQPPTVLHRYYFSFGQWLAQESSFWRRSLYERAGGLDESMFFAMDLSLFVRMWSHGKFKRVDPRLGAIRLHAETKTSRHSDVMVREARAVRRANGIPHFESRIANQVAERLIHRQAQLETLLAALQARFSLNP